MLSQTQGYQNRIPEMKAKNLDRERHVPYLRVKTSRTKTINHEKAVVTSVETGRDLHNSGL